MSKYFNGVLVDPTVAIDYDDNELLLEQGDWTIPNWTPEELAELSASVPDYVDEVLVDDFDF